MKKNILSQSQTLQHYAKICDAARQSADGHRCLIDAHPTLKKKLKREIKKLKAEARALNSSSRIILNEPTRPGFNDGLIYPGNTMPLGASLAAAKSQRLERRPLRGKLQIVIVLVDFDDMPMRKTKADIDKLFFSLREMATGSVREYFREVSNGLIDVIGEVVGPYRLPKTLSAYANNNSGIGNSFPNARTMARDAAIKADPDVDFSGYDNDSDGYVDAFIVVHAGTGGETTGNPGDIWSHKWVLQGDRYIADGSTSIYGYLTVPEDSRVGVCAHELGHLLFGFPDLYDTEPVGEGVGEWCLMGGGSWNNGGNTPAHPSAWCKCNQKWVKVEVPKRNARNISIQDVKKNNKVYKLWANGRPRQEYFLLENRQKKDFDKYIPSSGLLIWHIDDSIEDNTNENHYKVALVQADGKRQLESGSNRGDGGDCYPGTAKNKEFTSDSIPDSLSYGGVDSKVAVTKIRQARAVIKANIKVK